MAVEIVIAVGDLKEALTTLSACLARGKKLESQYLDVSASLEEITLETEGFSYALPGEVTSPGSARLPLPIVQALRRLTRLLSGKEVIISIVPGHFKLGSTDLPNPEITLRASGRRIADLPIEAPFEDVWSLLTRFTPEEIEQSGLKRRLQEADAPLRDILLLATRFTPEQIQQYGLERKYQEARQEAERLVASVAGILRPFGVSLEALREFVWKQFQASASST